ncbi:MAG: NAD-dependent epimerase/dehydratase family protein [Deltaproteobacteria bacterium]|nr:MAG: NAD-dependent epimerase/dehydratase family protein [Deltaproteobacteria bacterium]
MRVFVAGATGTLGAPTVRLLAQTGHDVRALARDAQRATRVGELGAEPVVADLFDGAAMRQAVAGCEAVLHLATRIPPISRMGRRSAWRDNDRVRTQGAAVLVNAALAAGARLYVQESITFLYADQGERWIDETASIDAVWPLASARDAERETARFSAGGGAGVVLRFALFYAPYAASTRDTIRLARWRLFPILGDGNAYMSAIHVDDAAAAVVAALALPAGIYNVADDEPLPQREYALALTRAFGFRAPFRVPIAVARVILGAGAPALLRSQRVANGMLKSITAWTPRYRSAREGWPAIARALA